MHYRSHQQRNTLTLLKHTVNNGWPKSIKDVPQEIQSFWNFREQIAIENGLLLKNTRIIIQNSLQLELVEWIHEGHLGLRKMFSKSKINSVLAQHAKELN